jgi:PAS domain S-box-containing protein
LASGSLLTPDVGLIDSIPQMSSILVVEDEPGDFGLIGRYLRQAGFGQGDDKRPLTWAKTLAEAIAAAGVSRPDLLLLDLSLPDSFGLPTLQAMIGTLPNVPIVVLTGHDDNDLAIAALKAGAQDYLVKGQFDAHALSRALRYARVRGKLESRLRLFEVALDSAADGIVITNLAGEIQWSNQAFSQLTGYAVEEALGHNLSDLLHSGDQAPAVDRQIWQSVLSGQEWRGEVVNRRKDGTLFNAALAIAPVSGGDGRIQNFVAIKQDISQRKQAERQIWLSQQRLELALAGSGLGFWDWQIPGGEVVFSERCCAMLGYRVDEIEAHLRSWERLMHPDDWPLNRATLQAHLDGETTAYESEYRLRHQEGHWVWVLDRGKVVVRDEAGHPLRAAGTLLDISHHKRINLESAHLLRRIESLIREASQQPALNDGKACAVCEGSGGNHPPGESGKPGRLSARQRQVLELVATGCTSAQIGDRLQISQATVVTHRRDIMRKLSLHSVAELTRYALQNPIFPG